MLAELGRGGMGVVWRAEDRVMGRQVAVGSAACRLLFDSALIVGDDRGRLAAVAHVPSAAAFGRNSASAGSSPTFADRDVHCVLRAADGGRLEGTRIAAGPG